MDEGVDLRRAVVTIQGDSPLIIAPRKFLSVWEPYGCVLYRNRAAREAARTKVSTEYRAYYRARREWAAGRGDKPDIREYLRRAGRPVPRKIEEWRI